MSSQRDALIDSLVRPRGIEVAANVLPEHTPQVPFAQDDDVIETLSPDATEKSFAHSVHPWGAGRNLTHFDAGPLRNTIEIRPVLLVPVPDQYLGPGAERGHFAQLGPMFV